MEINTNARGILEINDARIIYRNFSGVQNKFNREGDRNFAVVIPDQDICNRLVDDGWNVRVKYNEEDSENPFMYIPVKIKFNGHGPSIYLKSGDSLTRLDEESVSMIDNIDIESVDLDLRPYDWEANGKSGRTAYLQSICVVQKVDRFLEKYSKSAN